MLDEREIIYTIVLSRLGLANLARKRELLERYKSAVKVYEVLRFNIFSGSNFDNKFNSELIEMAKREVDFIIENKISLIRIDQKAYPFYLKQIVDAPLMLMAKGDVSVLSSSAMLSIVGTRKMTAYGHNFLNKFIEDLSYFKPTIVSGLAFGVDILSHRLALENDLSTVAVLGHGLHTIYPKEHRIDSEKMTENGLLLTEFFSDNFPSKINFPRRNRIIAGISRATVVVEAAQKGGALITASLAFDYNREVYALPGRQNDEFSKGCNNLIRQNRASILTSANDIVDFFGWEKIEEKRRNTNLKDLSEFQLSIVENITKDITNAEDIARILGVKVQQVQVELFNLELLGIIRNSGFGKIYLI